MINTYTALYVKRMETQLKAIQGQLDILHVMTEDDILDYNLETALEVIMDNQKAARRLDDMSNAAWLKLHDAERHAQEEEAENEPVQPGF